MAKTPKVKKREISVHSRAARRSSPPPKDIAGKRAPTEESDYKPWMHNAQNAGVSKQARPKKLTHAQRLRQERAQEKALAIANKLEKKVADSKKSSKNIQSRAADWDELNGKLEAVAEAKKKEGKRASGKDGADVVLPNLEQLLPVRSAEMSGAEEEEVQREPVPASVSASAHALKEEGVPAWASMHAEPEEFLVAAI
ncbi:hypothetical protein DOTSEDRAFT_69694 [Dothistroma septosporum NZE10]|uniref:Uncharacterized protein n=1 Tax=Dothistroma septosporum (strain NZE10 / CBS 128990) TaxID=675120 RepID=N1PWR0_DOTSN|nr:hypothetical protein DOTSEDRAFT_69694 [Dothistroma septosporum NZE10]